MGTTTLAPLGGGIDHPEGVCWDPGGAIVTGTEAGGLLWLDPEDGAVVRSVTIGVGLVAGIAVDGDGRAYACDVPGHRVVRVDRDGTVETFTTGPAEHPLRTPNYPVFAADGRLFVSDSGAWGAADGRIIVVQPDGTSRLLSEGPSAFTNGMALSPDDRYLYVVESSLPGIARLPLLPDGAAGPRELVVEMPRTVPDGIAFTADGLLLITCFRPDAVFTWDGARLGTLVEDWTGLVLSAPTNVAFTGHGLDRLISANLGGWHLTRIDAGMVGAPLHHPHLP